MVWKPSPSKRKPKEEKLEKESPGKAQMMWKPSPSKRKPKESKLERETFS